VHDHIEDKISQFIKIQKIINVLFSSFITLVVFADFGLIEKLAPDFSGLPTQITIGILSFILFIVNVLSDVFQIPDKKLSHLKAIQQYTELLSEIKNENASTNGTIVATKVVEFNEKYLQITRNAIQIGGRIFTKSHIKYIQKKCIALAAQKHPFDSKKEILNKSKSLVSDCESLEGKI